MHEPQAYLNGRWVPASAAMVSPTDSGFVLGATVAEQLRTFGGKLFHVDDHLARLAHSVEVLGLDAKTTLDGMAETAEELVSRNYLRTEPGDDLGLSIFVTPGIYSSYSTTSGPIRPTVCLHTYALPFHLWVNKYREGQSLVTTDIEQVSSRCWPTDLKCRSRIHYYLADRKAAVIEPQARALLLDSQGFVTEASTANLLIYNKDEGLASPPLAKVLHGISLSVVVKLAQQLGIGYTERDLTTDDVASADEVFLTSTPMCLLGVTRFNGRPIGDGQPGAVFRRLLSLWSDMVGVDILGQAERFARRPEKNACE